MLAPVQAVSLAPDVELAQVHALLDAVPDPEIPVVSIRELGILRAVRRLPDGAIEVVITPTYSGCPAMGQIEDDICAALKQANLAAKVTTQLAPAWTTDWMTPAARQKLQAYGIAPPVGSDAGQSLGTSRIHFAINYVANSAYSTRARGQFRQVNVPCPRCGSPETTETSHFASTACKALYKCLACMEPFDYFKPH